MNTVTHDHLVLRLVRLRHPEEWVSDGDGLTLVFPNGGVGQYASRLGVQPVAAGDVLILNVGLGGKLCVPPAGELVFRWFSLCVEHLFPLFGCNEICLLQGITDGFKTVRLYPASSPVALECHRLLGEAPPQFNLDHRGQLLRVVTAILTVEFRNVQPRAGGFVRVEEHMSQVFEKLSVTEILNLSVAELADRFSCSRRHLTRLFHNHFGVSVTALRMEMRLLKAMSLLRDPNAKVINVAEQCGFNHLGLFNTCFKRRFGTSPGHWRKAFEPMEEESGPLITGDPACRLRANGLCPWSGKPVRLTSAVPKLDLAHNSMVVSPLINGGNGNGKTSVSAIKTSKARPAIKSRIPVKGRAG